MIQNVFEPPQKGLKGIVILRPVLVVPLLRTMITEYKTLRNHWLRSMGNEKQ